MNAIKELAIGILKEYKGAMEVADFKRFLLLNFASGGMGGNNMLAMLGMGERSALSISYDPLRKLYFHRILGGNQELSSIYVYNKHSIITEKFITDEPASLLKDYLSSTEVELLGVGTKKKRLVQVRATDFQQLESIQGSNGKELKVGIDLVYENLESFIAGYEPRSRIFLFSSSKGDLLFDVNFTPLPQKESSNLITFDVYLDQTREIAKHSYVSMEKDGTIKLVDDVKAAQLSSTMYCLVVPVTSFNVP